MLPKRKIIKKRHQRLQQEQVGATTPLSLLQKLRSTQDNECEQALAFISSMCHFDEGLRQINLLAEIMAVLRRSNRILVHSCLFALANIAQIAPRVIPKLFELGLDKALLQLNSNEKQLLKPIMCLMLALHDSLPESYRFLQQGVQSSLTPLHLASPVKGLVLQFLAGLESGAPKGLSQTLYKMFRQEESLKIRSLCLQVLLQYGETRDKLIPQVVQFCEQLIKQIDLQKEYSTNIVQNKTVSLKPKETEAEVMEQQQQQGQVFQHVNYQTFIDAVEGVQLLCQTLLDIIEQNWQEQEDQQIEIEVEVDGPLTKTIKQFLTNNLKAIAKNCCLSFLEGQNIVALSLRLLAHSGLQGQELGFVVINTIRKVGQISPPEEVLVEILTMALHLLLNCTIPQEEKELLIMIGEKGLKIHEQYKQGWIRLLELFSMHFNPQKNIVTKEHNFRIGSILKMLIVNIPHLQLEEWRAQTLDTLFDIYSNEQFDDVFVSLGFMDLLRAVAERGAGAKKKKFIQEVLSDVNRFMEYKRKMIKF